MFVGLHICTTCIAYSTAVNIMWTTAAPAAALKNINAEPQWPTMPRKTINKTVLTANGFTGTP
jgi:hypothetical protein